PGRRAAPVCDGQLAAGSTMKQEQFVARHQQEWHDLEQWLQHRAGASRRRRRKPGAEEAGDVSFPQRYRRLC
ncbi:hypothetical protein CEJ63_27910, partial [Acinetobacter baumannii]